ncbi:hypothetical protein AQI96_37540 [Streptomyces canus]|uniref:GAF domain-containing sensor histidine kinase n=1 Tax=Streptomyces canus TaxID=58343 RepID=UPI0007486A92|nr:GAF domain-containing sensor histidine kinase [Streptomyces canus]KUN04325.1 hypothetical protein AQI96_37540 [Streptomyces canus]
MSFHRATQDELGRLMAGLVEAGTVGVVVMDEDGRRVYANEAAETLLRQRPGQDLSLLLDDESLHVTCWPFGSAGRNFKAMSFYESGPTEWQLRRVAAFARTASWIACRRPLQDVLDRVALEARNATGARACSVLLLRPGAFRVWLVGTAGHAGDYVDRLIRSDALGAPLVSLEACATGRPVRRSGLLSQGSDPRYEPLDAPTKAGGWDEVVAVPAVIQGQCVGVLTSFFGLDEGPADDDITFLTALADQVAVAVDNANLVTDLQTAAAEAERHDLAIDLHDSVSQALFSVIMQSRALVMRLRRPGARADRATVEAVSRLESTAEEMQKEVRGLLQQMNVDDRRTQGFAEDLTSLVERLTRGVSPKLRLELPEGELPRLDGATRRELLHVVREAVTNSIRHSGAKEITLQVDVTGTELDVAVRDDGAGFDPSQPTPGHLGLESMSRRTERVGGRLRIESSALGTVVRVSFPCPVAAREAQNE